LNCRCSFSCHADPNTPPTACSLKPTWIDSASQLSGKVKVGAIDCTVHQSTCQEYGVRGYPTIKFFGSNKQSPEDYQGGRDSGSIVDFASKHWTEQAPPREVRSSWVSAQAVVQGEKEGACVLELQFGKGGWMCSCAAV
jgi:thioredoxin-like negative regulator of GroEL